MNHSNSQPVFPFIDSIEQFDAIRPDIQYWQRAADLIIQKHHLPLEPLTLFPDGSNIVFAHGKTRVIKIFPPLLRHQFESENLVMRHLEGKISVKTPQVEFSGEIEGWPYIVMSRVEGTSLETLWENMDHDNKVILIRELGALIREVHSIPIQGLETIDCHWDKFLEKQTHQCVERHRRLNLPEKLLSGLPQYLKDAELSSSRLNEPVILTGEYTPMNLLVSYTSGKWHITGLIDFGDAMLGFSEYDLLGPGAFLIQGNKELMKEFLISYGYHSDDLSPTLSRRLTTLMLLHRFSNLSIQVRIENWKDKVRSLKDLENLIWGFDEL